MNIPTAKFPPIPRSMKLGGIMSKWRIADNGIISHFDDRVPNASAIVRAEIEELIRKENDGKAIL